MAWWNRSKKKIKELEAKIAELRDEVSVSDLRTWSDLQVMFSHGGPSAAGPLVTPDTAMRATVVFACVRLLSEAVAGLPIVIYKRLPDGQFEEADRKVANGLWWLLNEQPCSLMTAASFWEWMQKDQMLHGDGIAAIGRDRNGNIRDLLPIPRQHVTVERVQNRLRYYIRLYDGSFLGLDQDDVLHFPGFGFDGVRGMSVIQWAAKTAIGLSLAAEEYAARFFSNGTVGQFALEVPGALKKAQAQELRDEWIARYTGPDNAYMPLILTHGAKAHQLNINAKDAQLLESRLFQVADICRAFGVPPFMIGETDKTQTWGSGIEQMGLGFVRYTLKGPLQRATQEMNRKFWPRSTVYFLEFDTDALMWGDSAAELNYFRAALGGAQGSGWMSVNEIRRKKKMSKVPGGDSIYLAQSAPAEEPGDVDGNEETGERTLPEPGEGAEGVPALPRRGR